MEIRRFRHKDGFIGPIDFVEIIDGRRYHGMKDGRYISVSCCGNYEMDFIDDCVRYGFWVEVEVPTRYYKTHHSHVDHFRLEKDGGMWVYNDLSQFRDNLTMISIADWLKEGKWEEIERPDKPKKAPLKIEYVLEEGMDCLREKIERLERRIKNQEEVVNLLQEILEKLGTGRLPV